MQLSILDQKHSTYDVERWSHLSALSNGGKEFRALLPCFLPQNPIEPEDIYRARSREAHYRSYMGSIINLYSSWLFASAFAVKPHKRGTKETIQQVPSFYGDFQENVGNETQLSDFMKERFRAALTTSRAYWVVELPSNEGHEPESKADYEQRALGAAWLKPLEQTELVEWEEDEKGALLWAIVHTCFQDRPDWSQPRDLITETWRIYDRTNVTTFQVRYKQNERPRAPFDVPAVGKSEPHGFKRVPVMRMCLPIALSIGEQTMETQLEHFRESNAMSWLIRRTCYAQPVYNIEDPDNQPPAMGTGMAIMLGKDDKFGWTSPPTAPFDVLQKTVDSLRDEIYRIVHQMAQGMDNNAETVGRSADSKEIDEAATRVILAAYGGCVSKSIEETYELISEARGEDDYEWSVEGFSGYDTATVSSLLANVERSRTVGIPSQTFHKEICTKVALAMLPEQDQRIKDAIRAEIQSATFVVSSQPSELAGIAAKAKLDEAKADAEPIKANAAMKKASQKPPTPKPASSSPS